MPSLHQKGRPLEKKVISSQEVHAVKETSIDSTVHFKG
jgi:hypothetical protein